MAGRLAQRIRDLESLTRGLDLLVTEIGQGLVPLPGALVRASGGMKGPTAALFRAAAHSIQEEQMPVQSAWEKALLEALPLSALYPGDVEVLRSLGTVLGRSLSQDQIRHLELSRKRLESAAQLAQREADKGARLRVYLGILGAVALVIVLW